MIVVDTNVIAYLYLPVEQSALAWALSTFRCRVTYPNTSGVVQHSNTTLRSAHKRHRYVAVLARLLVTKILILQRQAEISIFQQSHCGL